MKSFFRFFAERHILTYLITIITILLGVNSLLKIKRDTYPEVEFGQMRIVTKYPGASPEDVERTVTNKIENELEGVSGLEKITSDSMEDVSFILVFIDPDESDQDEIKSEIREAVGRVTDFPDDVTESPTITEMKTSAVMEVIEVGLSGDIPYAELRELARLFEKKLKNVDGVSRLEKFGYRDREIKVEVSPEAIEKYQLSMREIIAAIRGRNIRATAGSFESYTSEKNLVTLAQFRDPSEVKDVIVRSQFDGPVIKIRDIATVKDSFEEETVLTRIDGKAAISFVVFKTESADVIRTCDAVKELVERERKNLPKGVEILYSRDTSLVVRNSFNVVLKNGLMGLVLVVIVLAIFLNLRTSFWVAMGIPVAMLGTIFVLPLFDVYLDTITLTGMILVIGIIVDDGIIISENIYRRREKGDEPLAAVVEGTREVFLPVLTTVLTTFLAFAPMFFMTGVFGKFIFVIPLAISLALFISLAEATVALPGHLMPGLCCKAGGAAGRKWFDPLRERYKGIVFHLLRFRYVLVPVFILILAGSLWYAGSYMKFILFPSDMANQFYIAIELPTGTSLQATADKVKEIEETVADLTEDELASFVTRIGSQSNFVPGESENWAIIAVDLTPFATRSRNADEIVAELRRKTDKLEGFEKIIYSIDTGGPPVGKPITLRIVGSDDEKRKELADSVGEFLKTTKGVKDVSRDDKPGKEQVEIVIDDDKLSRVGLVVADVAQNVRIAYDGEIVTSVRYGEEDVDFRVLVEEEARQQLGYLEELLIPNRQGRLIPLKEVARLETGPGPSDFPHFDGERAITITADVDKNRITPKGASDKVLKSFDLDKDWPGMRIVKGGEAMETEESMKSLRLTFVLAVIGIYFLLILLFNSLTQPILVLVAIPFGIIGVIIAFALHGEPLGFVAMMGVIGLCGVVVNDSLVLVDHINTLKAKRDDENILKLVAEGTANRLRAIVMTTLTTVACLMPLAYGLGGTDPFMAPMALALGWGLFFATPLTLVLVPCLYVIGQDIRGLFKRRERSAQSK